MEQLESTQLKDQLEMLCDALSVPKHVQQAAWNSITNYRPTKDSVNESALVACFVYMACIEDRASASPYVTLTDILSNNNLRIPTFFEAMRKVCRLANMHTIQHYKKVQKKYVITFPLFLKFERLTEAIFTITSTSNGSTRDDCVCHISKLSWILFIYLKSILFDDVIEIPILFYLLLCVLNHVIKTSPTHLLKEPYASLQGKLSTSESCILQQLCSSYSANYKQVLDLQENVVRQQLLQLPVANNEINIDALVKEYHKRYRVDGGINELQFLYHHPTLFPAEKEKEAKSHSTAPANTNSDKHGGSSSDASSSSCSSSSNVKSTKLIPPDTPVRRALNKEEQLHQLLLHCEAEPSKTLKELFQKCATNPEALIKYQTSLAKQDFIESYTKATTKQHKFLAANKYMTALRIYYKVLTVTVEREICRVGEMKTSQLLNEKMTHTALMACALEVVLKVSESKDLLFPWILKAVNVKAYDFWKFIETFIKAEPNLPREVIKHFQSIENYFLEELVWEPASPIFEVLKSNVCAVDVDFSNDRSPVKQIPSISPRKSESSIFLKKVCRLAHQRMEKMCQKLEIPSETQMKIWTCLQYVITRKYNLLKNRHLDQIMMCCIYVICKVIPLDVTFKSIAAMYTSAPNADSSITKRVYIRPDTYNTIIVFYNKVFTNAVKEYVFDNLADKNLHLSPAPKRLPSPLSSPKIKFGGHSNILLSPMKTPLRVDMSPKTPRSKYIYSFGEVVGSAEKLKQINDTVKSAVDSPARSFRSQKRLVFSDENGSSASSSAKRLKF